MTSFRHDFDQRVPHINAAIDAMPGDIESIINGLTRQKLKRFFQRFSVLFGRLDKNGAKLPQHLAFEGSTVPEYIIDNIDSIISQLGSGAATFAYNTFPIFVNLQDRLEQAVGLDADALKRTSIAAARDLSASISQSDELLERSKQNVEKLTTIMASAGSAEASISEAHREARNNSKAISNFRNRVEQLLSEDGRQRGSLDSLIRRTKAKEEEIREIVDAAGVLRKDVDDIKAMVQTKANEIKALLNSVSDSDSEARRVLGLSAQAGLARSYLTESKKLQNKAYVFTGLLYVVATVTILIAALYVLPSLEHVLQRGGNDQQSKLVVTLLRASILTPLVFVIYFTNRQINATEMLRMDYAEKAAASLAYSGYRDEMSSELSLLERLKGSLLLRFAEHPERLLRKDKPRERLDVESPGFRAVSESGDPVTKESEE